MMRELEILANLPRDISNDLTVRTAIELAIYRMRRPIRRKSIELVRDLIYVIHRVSHDNDEVYLLLNRDYWPVGMPRRCEIVDKFSRRTIRHEYPLLEWVNYREYKNLIVLRSDIASVLPKLSRVSGNYYLFDDMSAPWRGKKHADRYLSILINLRDIFAVSP